ncbi:MAG TPA: SDR family NAD(P)-dependent oxidoreductase [Pirellulales bacterium]|jgi:nucleoside-diphosphate-sugar epimerase|nr:SDR family NAD(P)-dependent oxidoreductase [Pirellulales bacterium]
MARTYLVTGGSGFIGSALVRRLVARGDRVRVLDDFSRGKHARLAGIEQQLDIVQGDIRDPQAVSRAVAGVDGVCHAAFVNGTRFFYERPELVLDVGVRGMLNVLDACIEHRVRELFVASSSEVYQTPPRVPTDETAPMLIPDPLNPRYSYAAGKIISEILSINYARKHFDRMVIFRPHNVFGPDMGWEHVLPQFIVRMQRLVSSQPSGRLKFTIQGSGRETRAFVYVDDFTDGLLRVMDHGKHMQIYNIGTEEELSIAEVAERTARYFGREVEIVPGALAVGGTARRCPDLTKLRGLGYAPRWSFDDAVGRTVDWYVAHVNEAPKE